MRELKWVLVGLLAALALVIAGCGGSSSGGSGSASTSSYVSGVTASGTPAVYHAESAPSGSGGPSLTVSGPSSMVPGGSATMSVTSDSGMTTVYVSIAGLAGYYEVTLPGSSTATELIVTLAQSLPHLDFTMNYAAADSGGTAGPATAHPVTAVEVGTGAVQVSVSWNTPTDVDLHLVEPDSTEIYYGNPFSADGGTLDLDSNADCYIDGVNNENITWPTGSPPHGTYTVRVDYYSDCSITGNTTYTVTVQVQGQAARTFSGTFSASDADFGGMGSGRTITTFTY